MLDRLDVLEGASDVPSLHQMTHVLHLQCDNLNERESPDSLLSTGKSSSFVHYVYSLAAQLIEAPHTTCCAAFSVSLYVN